MALVVRVIVGAAAGANVPLDEFVTVVVVTVCVVV